MSELASPNTRRRLGFGEIAAEDERQYLRKNFVSRNEFHAIRGGHYSIVLGSKGAGKTALRFWLLDHTEDFPEGPPTQWVDVSPDAVGWAEVLEYADCGVALAQAKKVAWLTVFVRECLDKLDGVPGSQQIAEEIISILREHGLIQKADRWSLRKVGLKVAALSMEFGKGTQDRVGFSQLVKVLERCKFLLEEALRAENLRVCLIVDQLDDHWRGAEAESVTLEGLLLAAKELRTTTERLRVLVFLRSDIWARLVFHEKDKLKNQIFMVKWRETTLISLIAQRIRASTGLTTSRDDYLIRWAFEDDVAVSGPISTRVGMMRFIFDHVQHRPRDVLLFCTLACQRRKDPKSKIGQSEVREALPEYSNDRYDNIQNAEAGKIVPAMARMLQALKGSGEVTTYGRVRRRITEATPGMSDQFPALFGALLEYEILGMAEPEPTFYSVDPHILRRAVQEDTRLVFHRSLLHALNLSPEEPLSEVESDG